MAGEQLPEISPEELQGLRPVSAPTFYASAFRIQSAGNDFIILLQKHGPAMDAKGGVRPDIGLTDTVAVLTLSPQSTKDLALLLQGQITAFEKEFGHIETTYTKRLKAEKKSKK